MQESPLPLGNEDLNGQDHADQGADRAAGSHMALVGPTASGKTSLALELARCRLDAEIVSVETVYVLVDARTLTKMPLPDSLRKALLEGASGRITDHAGHISSSAVSRT